MSRFQILSLDGGGLKGLFTASFLDCWERDTGRPVVDQFDLIVGTSTGGIIALALGLGCSAADIVRFYREEAETIFPEAALSNLKHWMQVKYSAEGLETALQKYFGERTLGECVRPLVIPAFYAQRREIYLFKTPHHPHLRHDWREKVTLVARSTAAAPTYFAPLEKAPGLELVDGGVWANNPIMVGIAEALGYLSQPQSDIAAVRIGTTCAACPMDEFPTQGGKVVMAAPAIAFMMDGQEKSAAAMAAHILGKERYYEVNPVAAPNEFSLDKLSEGLVGLGQFEYRTHSSNLADKGFLKHKPAKYTPYYPEPEQHG
jgi:patatin-like phospholipase/acyl hydrolase